MITLLRVFLRQQWTPLRNSLYRLAFRCALPVRIPDGIPGIRDPQAPCPLYQIDIPEAAFSRVACATDGHYLCNDCHHNGKENTSMLHIFSALLFLLLLLPATASAQDTPLTPAYICPGEVVKIADAHPCRLNLFVGVRGENPALCHPDPQALLAPNVGLPIQQGSTMSFERWIAPLYCTPIDRPLAHCVSVTVYDIVDTSGWCAQLNPALSPGYE